MSSSSTDTQEKIREVLLRLSKRERVLLSRVVRLERENLHIRQPSLKAPLLDAVKDTIK